MHEITVGGVRSQTGITTRKRDHAGHAQNNSVSRSLPPPGLGTFGPHPQSNCNQRPGSAIHGRKYDGGRPATVPFARATARRVVRSYPVDPSSWRRSWSLSARTVRCDRSTHSSIFGMNGWIKDLVLSVLNS
ncbi:hypothetical protein [Streptomyces flaveus]|uniref:hypothetical protein n=1 Tax=Streptomyces flaveus TaxID=66370 RepID=UPI001C707340